MANTMTPTLGLLWFSDGAQQDVLHLAPDSDDVEALDTTSLGESMAAGGFYLSNLPLNVLYDRLTDDPDMAERVFHDKGLIVSVTTVGDELGLVVRGDADEDARNSLLRSLRDAFQAACYRLGIDLEQTGVQQRRIRQWIFERTASDEMRTTSIEDRGLAMSPAPHRWVNVPLEWVDGVKVGRVTLLRHSLFPSLLRQPVPVGEWRVGSESATPEMILNAVGDHRDILLEAEVDPEHAGSESGAFLSVIATQEPRGLYTGQEVRRMVEEGIPFTIQRWWHGPTAETPALPETHPLSLADGLMLEMIHRSWRENPEIGFWLSIAERMTLHHLAALFHRKGIEVRGYGSGKLTVRVPNDPEAARSLEKRILSDHHPFGVQLPLGNLREHPELPELVESLTDQQVIALASPGLLGPIDACITLGDQAGLEALLEQADAALQALLDQPASTSTSTNADMASTVSSDGHS